MLELARAFGRRLLSSKNTSKTDDAYWFGVAPFLNSVATDASCWCLILDKKTPCRQIGVSGLVSALGILLLLEHRVRHGRWWDDKIVCHGKLGASLLLTGLVGGEIGKYLYTGQRHWREISLSEEPCSLTMQIDAKGKNIRK